MFAPRTKPLEYGEEPWAWGVDSEYQCTWWCFWRFYQVHGIFPTYQNRETKTGSYNNANTWTVNFRDPVEVKGKDYKPVAGDIVVYDWQDLGHVIFMETDTTTSEYRKGDPNSFRYARFGDFKSEILGYLHCPYDPVLPIGRDTGRDQIETTDPDLRIRLLPSLDGEIVGHVQIGFYNVLDKKEADGYTWYEVEKDRWIANITTVYHGKEEDDFVKEFERFLNSTKARISALESEKEEMRNDMKQISNIARRWSE